MKKRYFISFGVLLTFLLSSCLTAQYKEYKFEMTGKTSGQLTITYKNIFCSHYDDEISVEEEAEQDYSELVSDYLEGTTVEDDFPNAKMISKKLFEENNQLCGQIVLEFDNIEDINLYKYHKKAPFMFHVPSDEDYFDSNGEKAPEFIQLVVWDKKAKVLELTTTINEPDDESLSLLSIWNANK